MRSVGCIGQGASSPRGAKLKSCQDGLTLARVQPVDRSEDRISTENHCRTKRLPGWVFSCPSVIGFGVVLAVVASMLVPQPADAHRPGDPYVQAMVRPAVEYLKTSPAQRDFGAEALVGLALYKADVPPEDPRISSAVNSVLQFARGEPSAAGLYTMYATCVGCVLLCEVGHGQNYQAEIKVLLDLIRDRQRADGAWSYDGRPTGDISQTQYCVLALWTAKKVGLKVDPKIVLDALVFLITVQDTETHGWPYQGRFLGPFERIRQEPPKSMTLTAAGLGSVYIGASFLGYGEDPDAKQENATQGLPPAVSIVLDKEDTFEEEVNVNVAKLKACQQEGNEYFRQNWRPDAPTWTYYYLYAYERYASFREVAEGTKNPEPKWYNEGCEYLKSKQEGNGAWKKSEEDESDPIATSFAVLFLVRSTQKSLGISYSEALVGGSGLRDEAEVALVNGKVQSMPVAKDLPQLLSMIENPDEDELEFFAESVRQLDLSDPSMSPAQQRAALTSLVKQKQAAVRKVAVRTLGTQGRMENVPALIFALTDPDKEVVQEANQGLKFISRKQEGFDLSSNPSPEEIKALKERWTKWYLEMVPEGQLLD